MRGSGPGTSDHQELGLIWNAKAPLALARVPEVEIDVRPCLGRVGVGVNRLTFSEFGMAIIEADIAPTRMTVRIDSFQGVALPHSLVGPPHTAAPPPIGCWHRVCFD